MFTLEDFIAAYRKESALCLRLFEKIPDGGLDYRPTPGQRSTLELLRYVSYGPHNVVRRILAGDWTLGRELAEAAKSMPASDFPRVLQAQTDDVALRLHGTDPGRLAAETFTFPWGEILTKGAALVSHPLKWMTGYKMQLFLYLKAAGASELGTPYLWHLPK